MKRVSGVSDRVNRVRALVSGRVWTRVWTSVRDRVSGVYNRVEDRVWARVWTRVAGRSS